jgi:hypothetical protein
MHGGEQTMRNNQGTLIFIGNQRHLIRWNQMDIVLSVKSFV